MDLGWWTKIRKNRNSGFVIQKTVSRIKSNFYGKLNSQCLLSVFPWSHSELFFTLCKKYTSRSTRLFEVKRWRRIWITWRTDTWRIKFFLPPSGLLRNVPKKINCFRRLLKVRVQEECYYRSIHLFDDQHKKLNYDFRPTAVDGSLAT